MPFVYNAMKEMNLENEFDFRMGPRVVFYKIIKPNHPDIYEEIGKNMYRIWQENIAEYGI